MAWLSNLADKAETLLNRLDQNASAVLKDSNENSLENSDSSGSEATGLLMQHTSESMDTSADNKLAPVSITLEEPLHSLETNVDSPTKDVTNEDITAQATVQPYPTFEIATPDSTNLDNVHKIPRVYVEKIAYLRSKLAALSNKHAGYEKEFNRLNAKLQASEDLNESLNAQIKKSWLTVARRQEEGQIYKETAYRLNEEKEQLLLQAQNAPPVESDEHIEYVSRLIRSREELKKKCETLNENTDNLFNDLDTAQKQCTMFLAESRAAQQQLAEERFLRDAAQNQLLVKEKKIQALYMEIKDYIKELNLKDKRLDDLQKKADLRFSIVENADMESKFHILTNTLITKQYNVETLTSERNALKLQLEKTEDNYSKALQELKKKPSSSILNIDNFDDGKSSNLFTVSPFDEGVTRRVKRAISTLNTFSIRLGVFLRRYPVARVFLLCYMILLQIWVVLILFAYMPNSS